MQLMTRALTVMLAAGLAAPASAQTNIEWIGGTSNWNNPGNWMSGNIPNSTSERAMILSTPGSRVTLDTTVSIHSLEVAPNLRLTLDPGRGMNLSTFVVNNGLIELNPTSSTSDAYVQFNGNGTIYGSGILRLVGGGSDARLMTNGTTLINSQGHTIDGTGQIWANLINNGEVASHASPYGDVLELVSTPKVNNVIMTARPNSELLFSDVVVSQGSSGQIAANSGGTVAFSGSPTIAGGRIVGPGSLVRRSSGDLTLNGVSLQGDLEVEPFAGIFYGTDTFDCTGTIVLNDTASTSDSFIQFNADTTISGGGSIFLAGGGVPGDSNDSAVTTDGTVLTIAPDFTIEGSGELTAALTNDGMIRAFSSANGDGRLRLIDNTKTNNNLMLADAGGTLEISEIVVTQDPMGEILADGGTVEFVGSPTVNGGTIRTANGGTLVKTTSGNLSMSDTTLDGDLDVQPAAGVLYNSSSLVSTGSIILNDTDTASNSFIEFNANTSASGGGRIFLAGGGNDSTVQTNGTTLTIAPDFTIEGSGELRARLTNEGLIRAFPSANGDGRLRLLSFPKYNNAVIRADTGGVIEILGATVSQEPTGVILADGGTVEFASSLTVDGGTIRAINGGTLIKPAGGNLSLFDVAIDGRLDVEGGAIIDYRTDSLVCTDTIALNDTAAFDTASIRFFVNTTVSGGGRIFLGGSNNDSTVVSSPILTIAPDFAIEGSGTVGARIVNNGLVRAFPSEFGDGRLHLVGPAPKVNNAQMVADPGGTLFLNSVPVMQGPSGEILADGGTIEFWNSVSIEGGTLRTDNDGRILRSGSGSLFLTDVTLEGDLELEAPSTTYLRGTSLVNNSVIRVNSTDSTSNSVLRFDDDITVSGTGTVLLNAGSNDSQLTTDGATATFAPTQVLTGEGTMTGSFVVQGRFSPGLPVGRIDGVADIAFADTTLFVADTSGPGVGDGVDFSSGTITCDGDVAVRLGYVPQINDQFNLITAGTIDGQFDDVFISDGELPTNTAVRLVYTLSTVDVRFVCLADLATPYGVLDLSDINAFTDGFLSQGPLGDLAEPIGVFDLADINAFIGTFLGNCN